MSSAITAAGVVAVGTMVASNQASKAAEGAANAQTKAASAATQVERERLQQEYQQYQEQMAEYRRKQAMSEQQMQQTMVNLAPYMQAGQGALYEMMALTGVAAPQGAQMPATVSSPMTGGGGLAGTATAAPATQTGGRMGILGGVTGTMTPIISPSGEQKMMSPAALELGKGGRSISSRAWESIDPSTSPRAEAAAMYRQVASEMPSATASQRMQIAEQRLNDAYAARQEEARLQQARESVPTITAATSPYAGMTGQQAQQAAMGGLAASPYSYESMSSAENLRKIAESPLLQALTAQGEEAIMQNAARTGGLRGGNVQGALAQFRPQQMQDELLRRYQAGQSELANQYSRLQGIAGVGQQSILSSPTTAVGAMPTYSGQSQIPNLLTQAGQAQAGGLLAQGQQQQNLIGGLSQAIGYGIGQYNRPSTTDSMQAGAAWRGLYF